MFLLPKFSFRENEKQIETWHESVGNVFSFLDRKGPEAAFFAKTQFFINKALEEAAQQPHDIDYQGRWEDAFLYRGYENGKYKFLTGLFLQNIQEIGFSYSSSAHCPEFENKKLGGNWVVVNLQYKNQPCVPDTDIYGNKVIVGVTEPRLYLPDIVCKVLDLEFGYDQERNRYK
jgi:hypothetical protein